MAEYLNDIPVELELQQLTEGHPYIDTAEAVGCQLSEIIGANFKFIQDCLSLYPLRAEDKRIITKQVDQAIRISKGMVYEPNGTLFEPFGLTIYQGNTATFLPFPIEIIATTSSQRKALESVFTNITHTVANGNLLSIKGERGYHGGGIEYLDTAEQDVPPEIQGEVLVGFCTKQFGEDEYLDLAAGGLEFLGPKNKVAQYQTPLIDIAENEATCEQCTLTKQFEWKVIGIPGANHVTTNDDLIHHLELYHSLPRVSVDRPPLDQPELIEGKLIPFGDKMRIVHPTMTSYPWQNSMMIVKGNGGDDAIFCYWSPITINETAEVRDLEIITGDKKPPFKRATTPVFVPLSAIYQTNGLVPRTYILHNGILQPSRPMVPHTAARAWISQIQAIPPDSLFERLATSRLS